MPETDPSDVSGRLPVQSACRVQLSDLRKADTVLPEVLHQSPATVR